MLLHVSLHPQNTIGIGSNPKTATDFSFYRIRRKPPNSRGEIVHRIVKRLYNSKPTDIKGPFFDPVLHLSPLLSLEYGSFPYSSSFDSTKGIPSDQVIRSALKLPPVQETLNTQSAPQPPPEELALAINPSEAERFDPTWLHVHGEDQNLNNVNSTYTMGTATEDPVSSNACQGSGLTGADTSSGVWMDPVNTIDNGWIYPYVKNGWGDEPILSHDVPLCLAPWQELEPTARGSSVMYDATDERSLNSSGGYTSISPDPRAHQMY